MPRMPRYRIAALADLATQLRYAPDETRLRQMRNAERLLNELDPQLEYPDDFVIFRITGYRSDRAALPASVQGVNLIPDLATLIQQLSLGLVLAPDHDGRRAIPIEDAAAMLSISKRTIQRLRQDGLVCHSIVFASKERRLAVFEDALRRFRASHEQRLREAAAYSRLSEADRKGMVAEARRVHEADGRTRNATAKAIADVHGRGQETVRALLVRHDAASPQPIFDEHGRLSERDMRLIHRAVRFGVPISAMARRFGKTRMTIHRAVNRRRAELLRSLRLRHVELPSFDWPDAGSVILAAPPVASGLEERASDHDAARLIAQSRQQAVDEDVEQRLIAAYNFLKRRVEPAIAALDDWPAAGALDEIETDLRWAALIKQRLVRLAMPAAVARIEAHLGRALLDQPTERILALLSQAADIAALAAETIDPSRKQRLGRVVSLQVDRSLAAQGDELQTRRAAARHGPGPLPIRGLLDRVCPWQAWLDLQPRLRRHVARLDDPARHLLQRRYGFDGRPPLTLAHLASVTAGTAIATARRLATAEARLRAWARAAG